MFSAIITKVIIAEIIIINEICYLILKNYYKLMLQYLMHFFNLLIYFMVTLLINFMIFLIIKIIFIIIL